VETARDITWRIISESHAIPRSTTTSCPPPAEKEDSTAIPGVAPPRSSGYRYIHTPRRSSTRSMSSTHCIEARESDRLAQIRASKTGVTLCPGRIPSRHPPAASAEKLMQAPLPSKSTPQRIYHRGIVGRGHSSAARRGHMGAEVLGESSKV
jgi:hypothetical protein